MLAVKTLCFKQALQELVSVRPAILVVDDNKANCDVLAYRLRERGFCPVCAHDPLQGLDLLLAQQDDIGAVLLDFHMPEVDGLELAQLMRAATPARPGLPFLLLTSVTDLDLGDVEDAGISAYLTKPIKVSRLWHALGVALEGDQIGGRVRDPLITPGILNRAQTKGKRVLVVEDNLVNQKVVVKILEKAGVGADVAGDGLAALEAIERAEYALVLMDCQMPRMNGIDATKEVRRREDASGDGGHLPIIALTAVEMLGDQERCLAAGMDAFLAKPFQPRSLLDLVARYLRGDSAPTGG